MKCLKAWPKWPGQKAEVVQSISQQYQKMIWQNWAFIPPKTCKDPPNPRYLQQLVMFQIIYYMGCRGRENLRLMNVNTFKLWKDGDGWHYIHQVIDKHDKNHTGDNSEPANEARIYEQPGTRMSITNKFVNAQKERVFQ